MLCLSLYIYMSFYNGAFAQKQDQIKILGQFIPDDNDYTNTIYNIKKFEMSVSNNSQICPSNNCKFQFTGGNLNQNSISPNLYYILGILRVGIQEDSETMRYKVYDIDINFKVFETLEKPKEIIHFVDGTINIGDISDPQFKYQIVNASLTIAESGGNLDVFAQSNEYAENNDVESIQNTRSNYIFHKTIR